MWPCHQKRYLSSGILIHVLIYDLCLILTRLCFITTQLPNKWSSGFKIIRSSHRQNEWSSKWVYCNHNFSRILCAKPAPPLDCLSNSCVGEGLSWLLLQLKNSEPCDMYISQHARTCVYVCTYGYQLAMCNCDYISNLITKYNKY